MNNNKLITILGIAVIVFLSVFVVVKFIDLSNSISGIDEQKKNIGGDIKILNDELSNLDLQISIINSEIKDAQQNIEDAITEIEYMKNGNRYELHDPAYSEVGRFIYQDKTNDKQYDEDTFNCAHYSMEVNNNSEGQGIRCAYVIVELSRVPGHACIAFNTTDHGLIYYEPQYDSRVFLEVEKDYWADCMIAPGGYYYEPDPDCIIEDFTLYW